MHFLLILLFLFAQPVLWLVMIKTWLTTAHRLKRERKNFHVAIYQDYFEWRHVLVYGITFGIVGSLVMGLIGVVLPLSWVLTYGALMAIVMVVLPTFVLPITIAAGSALLIALYPPFGLLVEEHVQLPTGLTFTMTPNANLLALIVLLLAFTGWFITRTGGRFNSARISRNRRGVTVASFGVHEALVMPLLTLVPGDWFVSHLQFWPVFYLGGRPFALLVLPIVFGLRLTVKHQLPRAVMLNVGHQVLVLAAILVAFLIASFWWPVVAPVGLGVALLGYWMILLAAKQRDRATDFWYSVTDEGVRVLGIQPETPAARMSLVIGDLIVACNGQTVTDEASFYKAMSLNSAYCRLRLKRADGSFDVTEAAIYDGSPHELGIVMVKD